jgi:hypothetical protein
MRKVEPMTIAFRLPRIRRAYSDSSQTALREARQSLLRVRCRREEVRDISELLSKFNDTHSLTVHVQKIRKNDSRGNPDAANTEQQGV